MLPEESVERKRLLVSAYAISPTLGSEWRSAWEITKQLSKDFDVTLLYGNSDGLHGSSKSLEDYIEKFGISYSAVKVESPKIHVLIHRLLPPSITASIVLPILVHSWNKRAFKIAQKIHTENPFSIAHQLGPIGFRNPGYLWKLNCHTYWGPIGGAQYINLKLIKNKKSAYFLEALYRNLSVRIQAFRPYINNAAKFYNKLSFATVENAQYFKKHFHRDGPIISDQGLNENFLTKKLCNDDAALQVAWIGSLTSRKNIDLLIDIMKCAPSWVRFNIFGGGPGEAKIIKQISCNDSVRYHGHVTRDVLHRSLLEMDAFLMTSHSEANTASLLEALECNCIPILPRRNGFVSILNDKICFYMSTDDYQQSIDDAVGAFISMKDSGFRSDMVSRLEQHKPTLTWKALANAHSLQFR